MILDIIAIILSGFTGLIIYKFLDDNKDNLSYDIATLERREGNNDNSNK